MTPEKLCTHLSREKGSFYCLLKNVLITNSYAERICFNESLAKSCIGDTKPSEGVTTLDKIIDPKNKILDISNPTNSSIETDKFTDLHQEILARIALGKTQLKKVSSSTKTMDTPTHVAERTKIKKYSAKAKDYETMAQKMRDSEIYAEAAINICCASLAWILVGDIKKAIRSLKNFVDTLDD